MKSVRFRLLRQLHGCPIHVKHEMHHGQSRGKPKETEHKWGKGFTNFAEIGGEYAICVIGLGGWMPLVSFNASSGPERCLTTE